MVNLYFKKNNIFVPRQSVGNALENILVVSTFALFQSKTMSV